VSKVWYCVNCGYEVGSRGKCHSCGQRLTASSLPELVSESEDDEVGYRLGDWDDADRGQLIEHLNRMEILHRFEDEELIVGIEDEERVDDLIAEVTAGAGGDPGAADDDRAAVAGEGSVDYSVSGEPANEGAVRLLYGACHRLRVDPTDMGADVDAAEASTAVFMSDFYPGADDETWAAVGRVTRRLLGALGSEEALEDEIRSQAAVLQKLLAPFVGEAESTPATEAQQERPAAVSGEAPAVPGEPEPDGTDWTPDGPADEGDGEEAASGPGETVYELTEWLPEERAQLDVLLDDAGIGSEWEGDELLVPSDREAEVERIFEQVRGSSGMDDDGETIYHAIEELFAAAGRLVGDPSDEQRRAEAAARITGVIGPPPFGFDEVQWLRIMKLSRALAEQIEADGDSDEIHDSATELRDLLRTVV
jgi:hypothetical protein